MIETVFAQRYQPLVPQVQSTANQLSGGASAGNDLSALLNQWVYLIIGVAVVLAIFMIIRGGYGYMTSSDNANKKTEAKNRIKAAFGGLLLALGAVLILQTINPNITRFTIIFPALQEVNYPPLVLYDPVTGLSGEILNNEEIQELIRRLGSGEERDVVVRDFLDGLQGMRRGTDGRLVFTTYGSSSDSEQNRLTSLGFGNRNNLLIPGSIALSEDLIDRYNPRPGQEIFVNGVSIGFYDDSAGSAQGGSAVTNLIDVYDPSGTIGSRLVGIPPGQWQITLGDTVRQQMRHPGAN